MISGPGYGVRAVVVRVRPNSLIPLLQSGRAALDSDRNTYGRNVPSTHFDDRRRRSWRRETRRQGKRFAGPQRDVIVAPQDWQHELAARGSLDRHVLEQRRGFGGWGTRRRT